MRRETFRSFQSDRGEERKTRQDRQRLLPGRGRDGNYRPAQWARRDEIFTGGPCILAGDFNAHSLVWNPKCLER